MNCMLFGLVSVVALGGVAAAAPALTPIPSDLPARCRPLAEVPGSATIPGPAIAARISVANCLAEDALNRFTPSSDDGAIARMETAVAPSLAMLDNVSNLGDPYWAVVAQDAKRDLYLGMMVRERGALVGGDARARDALEVRIAKWSREASTARDAIVALSHANPRIANQDPVIAGIIERDTEPGARVSRVSRGR